MTQQIEGCIDEWLTGTRVFRDFGLSYQALYEQNLKELDRFEEQTKQHDLLNNLLVKIYNRGRYASQFSCQFSFISKVFDRFHAGVQPMSTVGLPTIPDSAFKAALKEYEEDPNTDTDGENGDSD